MTPDRLLEERLGRILGAGGAIATVLLAAGLVVFFIAPAHAATAWLLHGGLILLMATPVARVVAAAAGYLQTRNWLFASLTLMVLSVLLAGVVIAMKQ